MVWVFGLMVTLVLIIVSPLASSRPDGLEWVAMQSGFMERAREPLYQIIPDYLIPGISNEAFATILAGILGASIVFIIGVVMAITRRNRQSSGG